MAGNRKFMKPRCQVCDMLETRGKKIPEQSAIQPRHCACDLGNIVYFLMGNKCLFVLTDLTASRNSAGTLENVIFKCFSSESS